MSTSLLAALVLLSAAAGGEPSFAHGVDLGVAASEQRYGLVAGESVVEEGALGEPCRRLGPDGYLRLTLPCASNAYNYLTVKLWGGDTGSGQLYLYDGEHRIGGYQRPQPELDMLESAPFFPGRFYYSTYLFPEELTKGKSEVTVLIGSSGQPRPYSTDKKDAQQKGLSRGIHAVYIGTEPFFAPEGEIRVGEAPKPAPESREGSSIEHLRKQIDQNVERFLTWQYQGPEWDALVEQGKAPEHLTGAFVVNGVKNPEWTREEWNRQAIRRAGVHARCMMIPEILALAHNAPWSKYHDDPELVRRVVAALDYYRIAQGSDGGFPEIEGRPDIGWVGGPDRRPASGCLMGFGMQGVPSAFLALEDAIRGKGLEEPIDHDASSATPPIPRGQAYTELFRGIRDYLVSPKGRGHAPNQDMANIHAAYMADRCLALLAPDAVWSDTTRSLYLDAACGFGKDIYGGRWISRKGLSMEPNGSSNGGYCGNYGEHVIAPLFRLAEMTGDARIRERALLAAHALSRFRYPSIDAEGRPVIRTEGVVTWRNNHTPGRVSYGGNPYAAAVLKDALSLREIQLAEAHGYYARVDITRRSPHIQSLTLGWLRQIDLLEQALRMPPSEARMPFEEGQPDFAWADEESGNVVVKRGGERLMVALNWRHGYKARTRSPKEAICNYLARIHHRTPEIARVANVHMNNRGGFGGLHICRYGEYLILMNTSREPAEYDLGAWSSGKLVDLVTGEPFTGRQVPVASMTTCVLAPNTGEADE